MFSLEQLTGQSLPHNTLCFTFDDGPGETVGDGPGPKTLPLAEYLHAEGIPATFFCVGKFIEKYPEITAKLDLLGHIVGNHSFSHPNMYSLFETGDEQDIINEIEKTDELIRKIIPGKPVFFRAPYGLWRSKFSKYLNKNRNLASNYFGPVHWDIGGHDFKIWEMGGSAEECAKSYLEEIEAKRCGIVLFHDSTADIENMRLRNKTFETIKILLPVLKDRGYQFIGLDKVLPEGNGSSLLKRFLDF